MDLGNWNATDLRRGAMRRHEAPCAVRFAQRVRPICARPPGNGWDRCRGAGGDINKGELGIHWAASTFPGKQVIYVAGNHEFYGGHWDSTLTTMRAEAKQSGIHFLENDSIEIDGVRFLG